MISLHLSNIELCSLAIGVVVLIEIFRRYTCQGILGYAQNKFNEEILRRCPTIVKNKFVPTIYFQHKLLQTIYFNILGHKRNKTLPFIEEEVNMTEGGHTTLAWPQIPTVKHLNEKRSKVLVVVIPGLTGHPRDNYVKDMCHRLALDGYRSVLYLARWNGGLLVLPQEGHIDIVKDFKATIAHLRKKEPNMKLFCIGHSYGANLIVNYLGLHPEDNAFIGAVSLANPFNLLLSEIKIRHSVVDQGVAKLVTTMVRRHSNILSKDSKFSLDLHEIYQHEVCRDFDQAFTCKIYGYETSDDYYWGQSSSRRIKNVKVPLFVLQAKDDPLIESRAYIKKDLEQNPNIVFMLTPYGGHQGWVEGFFSLKRWYLKPIFEYLNAVVDLSDI